MCRPPAISALLSARRAWHWCRRAEPTIEPYCRGRRCRCMLTPTRHRAKLMRPLMPPINRSILQSGESVFMSDFFELDKPISYEGPSSRKALAYQWYNPEHKVMGKTLAEHLRFAVCYWHSFSWTGVDPFGA